MRNFYPSEKLIWNNKGALRPLWVRSPDKTYSTMGIGFSDTWKALRSTGVPFASISRKRKLNCVNQLQKPGCCQCYCSNRTATPTYNYWRSTTTIDIAAFYIINTRMQNMHKYLLRSKRQRCVRVELTRDCAEQPPSRFEDGRGLLLASSLYLFEPLLKRPEPIRFLSFCLDVATV